MGVTRIRYLLRQWHQSSMVLVNAEKRHAAQAAGMPSNPPPPPPAQHPPPEKKPPSPG